MFQTFKVLFLGDIVGRPGRDAVKKILNGEIPSDFCIKPPINERRGGTFAGILKDFDFVIANVENASHGFGLTKKNHDELKSYGIDCMTSGNHIWDKKDIYTYIDESDVLIRPYNYHKSARGAGYRVFRDKIVVINLLGKTFMQPVLCPFQSLYDIMRHLDDEISLEDKIVIVDYHAEATAEKICFANFAKSLGVSAVFGTHTHVPTADERIMKGDSLSDDILKCFQKDDENRVLKPKDGMAYITDVGFCGAVEGVIGMEYESSLRRLVTSIPERFDVAASSENKADAVSVCFDFKTGNALEIERINFVYKADVGNCAMEDGEESKEGAES